MQCSVTALNCPKLSSGDGTTTATSSNSVYSEGLYLVKTVDINSKELVASLQGLKKLECYAKDFKAILQPWHIKQVRIVNACNWYIDKLQLSILYCWFCYSYATMSKWSQLHCCSKPEIRSSAINCLKAGIGPQYQIVT